MKKAILIILAIVVLLAASNTPKYKTIKVDGMKIQGPAQFREDVTEALDMLSYKAPEHYALVVGNIKKVCYDDIGDFNGIRINRHFIFTKTAYENEAQKDEKLLLIAIMLVHEGRHAQRLKDGTLDTDNLLIEECYAVQTEKEAAKLLDAPQWLLNWLDVKLGTKYWEK